MGEPRTIAVRGEMQNLVFVDDLLDRKRFRATPGSDHRADVVARDDVASLAAAESGLLCVSRKWSSIWCLPSRPPRPLISATAFVTALMPPSE